MKNTLDEHKVHPNPLQQFSVWFNEALQSQIPEPNAMTLATASADGIPTARIVLLKGADDIGFVFYTNYNSAKAADMADNPHASLLFFWVELQRQIRIDGVVHKVSREESEAYFTSRPEGSKIGAWASKQSAVIENRAALESQFAIAEEKFANSNVPTPEFWGGYRVVPTTIEFWQGRENRLHDRIQYQRVDNEWTICRLQP